MNSIVDSVREILMEYSEKSKAKDGYDFWNEHIKFVVMHARELAAARGADVEVCEVAALLHDIAMVAENGPREEHHIYGAEMARGILVGLGYSAEKTELVVKCVLHHRGKGNEVRGMTRPL